MFRKVRFAENWTLDDREAISVSDYKQMSGALMFAKFKEKNIKQVRMFRGALNAVFGVGDRNNQITIKQFPQSFKQIFIEQIINELSKEYGEKRVMRSKRLQWN